MQNKKYPLNPDEKEVRQQSPDERQIGQPSAPARPTGMSFSSTAGGQGTGGQTTAAQSATVAQAQALLNQNRGGYQSKWSDQISNYLDQILNRDKFSYDLNSDALYQQYADQYARNGQMAMMDTMGQAAALTGGYGNSYAQAVGQQTYQNYMGQLNDVMPELYSMALNQYMNEGDQLNNQLAMMMQQDEIDYGRYQDRIAEQQNNFDRLMALMLQYGYNPTEEEMANAGMTSAQRDAIMKKTKKRGSSVSSTGGGGGTFDPARIKLIQQMLNKKGWNVPEDGVFGEETRKAYYEYVFGAYKDDKKPKVPTAADLWNRQ